MDIPVVFAMVINWRRLRLRDNPMVTGISLKVPAEDQLTQLKLVASKVKRLGVIYNPAYSGDLVARAKEAAANVGVEIIAVAVKEPSELEDAWKKIKAKIDAFWMLRDPKVYTAKNRDVFQKLLQEATELKFPFLGASQPFVKKGCLMAIDADYEALGFQAAALARNILENGVSPKSLDVEDPVGTRLTINLKAAEKIGLKLDPQILQVADEIVGAEEED